MCEEEEGDPLQLHPAALPLAPAGAGFTLMRLGSVGVRRSVVDERECPRRTPRPASHPGNVHASVSTPHGAQTRHLVHMLCDS